MNRKVKAELEIDGKDKMSRALADSNRMIEESISGAAASLGDGGRETGGAIKDELHPGAQGGKGIVNADTGRTFPPDISKPGVGG